MLHSSKHKKNLANHNNNVPYMLINYAKDQKTKNGKMHSSRTKGKQNKKSNQQKATDFFVEDCIKFKKEQDHIIRKEIDKQEDSPVQFPLEESFGRIVVNPSTKKQSSHKKDALSNTKGNKSMNSKLLHENSAETMTFKNAIKKIFKDLDIFNRGRISQTNINKWIPESALYFLGGVFQKIKLQRLSLTQNQFVKLCLPLMDKSNGQDIKAFVEQVLGKESKLNVSYQFEEEEKNNQNSPVVKRINVFSHSQKQNKLNQQKIINTNKKEDWLAQGLDHFYHQQNHNSHHKNQISPIQHSRNGNDDRKQTQKAIRQTIDNHKQKVKQFNYSPLSSNKKKQQPLSVYPNKYIQVNSFTSNVTKRQPVKNVYNVIEKYSNLEKKELQNIIYNKKRSIIMSQSTQLHNKTENKYQQPPNFTFHIDSSEQLSQNSIATFHPDRNINRQLQPPLSNRPILTISYNQQKVNRESVNMPPRPKTSRLVPQPQNVIQSNSKDSRRSSVQMDKDTQKIDRLSSRIQEYLKFNREKIEQNSRFIRQNSTPQR